MKPMTKAIVVALIQATLVCSLGAKLLYDRSTRPRAWFKAERYDPNLPIRGRYLSLQLQVKDPLLPEDVERKYRGLRGKAAGTEVAPVFPGPRDLGWECGSIDVSTGKPVAVLEPGAPPSDCANLSFVRERSGDGTILRLREPVLFFIADTAQDPTHLVQGEDLWVLSTVPRKGPPRPISLGITRAGETAIRPLNLN
jgi:hypothetical protein